MTLIVYFKSNKKAKYDNVTSITGDGKWDHLLEFDYKDGGKKVHGVLIRKELLGWAYSND